MFPITETTVKHNYNRGEINCGSMTKGEGESVPGSGCQPKWCGGLAVLYGRCHGSGTANKGVIAVFSRFGATLRSSLPSEKE